MRSVPRFGGSALSVRFHKQLYLPTLFGIPKKLHTELQCSPDGPWLTLRDGDNSLKLSLREIIRGAMFAAGSGGAKRTMAGWLRARDAEGKQDPLREPPKKNQRAAASGSGVTPASRLIPPPKAKVK